MVKKSELKNEVKEESVVKEKEKSAKKEKPQQEKETKKRNKKPLIISLVSVMLAVCIVFVGVLVFFLNNKDNSDEYNLFSKNLLAVKLENGWGYVNKEGKIVITPQFEKAFPFSDNGLALVSLDGYYGFINTKGQYVVNPIYSEANSFDENSELTVVKRNQKYGYINSEGKEVIACQFESAYRFAYDRAVVKIGGKYGFINTKGQFVINPIYDYAETFVNNKISVVGKRINEEMMYACVAKNGKVLTDFMLNNVYMSEDYVITYDGTYYGLCKLDLVPLFRTDYKIAGFSINLESFGSLDNKLIPFMNQETFKYGYLNLKGQVVVEAKYDVIGDFNDGLAFVKYDGKYGYVNATGEVVINNTYDNARDFNEGYAVVCNDGNYGLINTSGKIILELKYASLDYCVNGLIAFSTSDSELMGYMNTSGEIVIPKEYTQIGVAVLAYPCTDDGYVVVKQGANYGVLDKTGKYIINPYVLEVNF